MSDLDALGSAVQAFSNSMCENADDVGHVTGAVTVWEETSFDEDGDVQRAVHYAVTGEVGLATVIGLLHVGLAQVTEDSRP